MKKGKRIIKSVVLLFLGSILFISCARDGRDGRDGFDGFDGRDGNPIVRSQTYFVSPFDWNVVSFGAEVNFINTDITNSVVQTGLVQAFFSLDANPNGRRWIALPYYDFSYSYVEGMVTFEHYENPGSPDDLWYKVIVIPSSAKIEGLNINDYEAVSAVYGLEEEL